MNILYFASRVDPKQKIIRKLIKEEYVSGGMIIEAVPCKLIQKENFLHISSDRMAKIENMPYFSEAVELEGDFLRSIELYKSTIMNILSLRQVDLYIDNYFYVEKQFLKMVRYWKYILNRFDIDFIFFENLPHNATTFSLYSVAKVLNIPTLLVFGTHIPELWVMGTSIDKLGDNVGSMIKELRENKEQTHQETEIKHIVDRYKGQVNKSGENKLFTKINKDNTRKQIKKEARKKLICGSVFPILGDVVKRRKLNANSFRILSESLWAKSMSKGIEFYNKRASSKIKDEKFIFFAMQLSPEATTLPWAGVFSNQLLSIRLLASALDRMGIKLYVKEHWVQQSRPKDFFLELLSIPNVVLIHTDIDSTVLIDKAIATATQTGSCISECILRHKPVIAFTSGWWKEVKSVFIVDTYEKIINAVEDIEHGNIDYIKEEELYYKAIEMTNFRWSTVYEDMGNLTEKDICRDGYDLIKGFIESGLEEGYNYRRSI